MSRTISRSAAGTEKSNQVLEKQNSRERRWVKGDMRIFRRGQAEGLTCCHKGIATLCEDLHEVVGQIPASQIQAHDSMRQSIPFINGHIVGDSITGVKNNTWKRNARNQLESPDKPYNTAVDNRTFSGSIKQRGSILASYWHAGLANSFRYSRLVKQSPQKTVPYRLLMNPYE